MSRWRPGKSDRSHRCAQSLFVLWAVATLLFFLFRLMPGDPVAAFIDTTFTEEQEAPSCWRQFGLDHPLLVPVSALSGQRVAG